MNITSFHDDDEFTYHRWACAVPISAALLYVIRRHGACNNVNEQKWERCM